MNLEEWAVYCRFRPAFAEVIDERYHSLDWLDQQIIKGEFHFWHSPSAAMVTEVRSYPTGAKAIHGIIAAGELEEITETLIPQAEDWAKENGCIAALVESRPGWARHLRQYGYETHQVIVRKEF